jgi:ESS family glutamate:Na+ symporter
MTDADPIVVRSFLAFTLGMSVYFLGAFLTRRWSLLRNFNIPEPVTGGLLVALAVWGAYEVFGREITFELTQRDLLLVIFFSTIGLNARFADLLRGGKPLAILLLLTVVFLVVQNVIGLLGAVAFGLPTGAGVLLGSASLVGGHGTSIAWGPVIGSQFDLAGAVEMGVAAATIGLVVASLIGGPVAQFLIARHKLEADPSRDIPTVGLSYDEEASTGIDYISFMYTLLIVNVTVILGWFAHSAIDATGFKLPLFVPCLIVGILIANLQPVLAPRMPKVSGTQTLALIAEFSLCVFLAMSLMSISLWTLADLAGPLFLVIGAQALMAALFTIFVLFRLMGSDYRAAVLASGFCGFALGATPTAMANMTAVTKRYGPSPTAFIILPLVSAFFVDLANAVVIQVFLLI